MSSGFEVNARDEYGQTPLHWAATRGHKDTIEALLAHGADSNLVDHGLYKPIGLATKVPLPPSLLTTNRLPSLTPLQPKIRRLLAPSLLPTYNLAGSNSTDGLAFVRFFDERPGEQKSLVDLAAAACWNVHNKGKDWLNKVPRDLLERLEKIRVQTCCVCGRVCNPAFTTVVEYKVNPLFIPPPSFLNFDQVRYLSQETGKPEEYDWSAPPISSHSVPSSHSPSGANLSSSARSPVPRFLSSTASSNEQPDWTATPPSSSTLARDTRKRPRSSNATSVRDSS